MLKADTAPKFSILERFLPSSLVEKLMLKMPFKDIQKGILNLNLLGQTYRFEGKEKGHHAELTIVNPVRAYWLLKSQGDLGFAQAYYEGVIDTNSLYELLYVGYENQQAFGQLLSRKTLSILKLWQHRQKHNSIANSRQNIAYHYDLGNEFYQLWLDETMSYSSAMFSADTHTMEQAQEFKYNNILKLLGEHEPSHILEIGCGWGGFMDIAIEKGHSVTGLTLSKEQRKYAVARLREKYSSGRFEVKLQDYRQETQTYDHIVSIEMFEAVGKEYWDTYFETLKKSLKPTGKAALQVITIDDEHAENYQSSVDFIQAYIFPGGLLPSVKQLESLAQKHGFKIDANEDFGADYGVTCQLWKQDFNKHSDVLIEKGYDRAFQRLWNYYLDYCTVGFETGHISVNQIVLSRIDEATYEYAE